MTEGGLEGRAAKIAELIDLLARANSLALLRVCDQLEIERQYALIARV
jgi:hypothetical protein